MKQCITVDEQIALLKSHGVSFELMSESDAREFLYSRSYFFKIKSYERNYTRVDAAGSYTYSGLDFAHLVELSYLDFALSRICLSLALSTEHFLKVRLNQLIMSDPKSDLSEVLVRRILNGDTSSIRYNPYTEDMWMACNGPFHLAPVGVAPLERTYPPLHVVLRLQGRDRSVRPPATHPAQTTKRRFSWQLSTR